MTNATRTEQYTGKGEQVLYLAFELGAKEWKLGFTTDLAARPRIRVMPAGQLERLRQEIADAKGWYGLAATAPVRSAYEAGRDGFWLHRSLTADGVHNLVVDSASIEVNRRQRRAKSDRLDVRKLLTMLLRYHAGEQKVWSVVRVPTPEEEDRRHLHRELRTLKEERTAVTNRLTGLLANQGIHLPPGWRHRTLDELLTTRLWDGSALPPGLRARLQGEWEHVQFLSAKIQDLERARQRVLDEQHDPATDKVRRLLRLRGIGPNGAWVYVHEFFGWRQFRNRKQVGGAAGLTPTPYDSGDDHREQGISKAGNRYIRDVAVEVAWCWLRYQPHSRLTRWYQQRFAHGGAVARKVGIVAVARKLLIDLWRFLEHGVIPDGAVLKAA